ncbi:MAG: type IV toxin-antitoxin system AbiEi family antitoxin domain-containing protein [Microlunatus sp.]|nr:type IV toxin-antitoxin system AbiEi family antitoxin domain-containing protein [Microlunatus sp.]
MKEDLQELFRGSGGAIRRSDHPKFQQRLDRLCRQGRLERPLPGVFALPGTAEGFEPAVIAGSLWAGPDAVFVTRSSRIGAGVTNSKRPAIWCWTFTWCQITEDPDWVVACIRRTLAQRGSRTPDP